MKTSLLPLLLPAPVALVLGAALMTQSQASLAETPFVSDAEPDVPRSVGEGRKWQEGPVRLPSWPKDRNLVEVKLDGPSEGLRYFVDTQSLVTAADGVVRYTLVTESGTGARNLSFEGLRCTPKGRYKVYAYGAGGGFTPTRAAEDWRVISDRAGERVHFELWRHYLCDARQLRPRSRKDQIRMLRSGRVPQVEDSAFTPQ
ncbi:MAG: CNP1-like family protein [Thiohalocapsa sp.]|jgi:hypothetical protein